MYYSQSNQDKFIDNLFKQKKNGVFLDIGAHDGISFSNTYFFEKNRNWEGICIEPIPEVYKKLDENRNCFKINCCISDVEKDEVFIRAEGYTEMLSGLKKNYNEAHFERLKNDIKEKGGKFYEITVKAMNINKILENNNIKIIDYCSIDTEGSEFSILQTIDFDSVKIKSFSIENNYNQNKIHKFMQENGYLLLAKLSADEIYVKKNEFNKPDIRKILVEQKIRRIKTKIKTTFKF